MPHSTTLYAFSHHRTGLSSRPGFDRAPAPMNSTSAQRATHLSGSSAPPVRHVLTHPTSVLVAVRNDFLRAGICAYLAVDRNLRIAAEASSAQDAIELAAATQPSVLVLGPELVKGSDAVFIEKLRASGRAPGVLVMMEEADEARTREWLSAGATGLVTVGDEPLALVEGVRAAARGGDLWFSPRVVACMARTDGRRREVQPDVFEPLSGRERAILDLVAAGRTNEEIVRALHMAEGTLRNSLSRIYAKIGVSTRAGAVAWAWRQGAVRPDGKT